MAVATDFATELAKLQTHVGSCHNSLFLQEVKQSPPLFAAVQLKIWTQQNGFAAQQRPDRRGRMWSSAVVFPLALLKLRENRDARIRAATLVMWPQGKAVVQFIVA